jgi:hypothetical protein
MAQRSNCWPIVSLAILLLSTATVRAEELRLTARQLLERSSVQNLQLSADGKSIELIRGLLIENDGDAAGFSYKPNEENLSDGTTAIKWLTIPDGIKDFSDTKACLLVGHTGKRLLVEINGTAVVLGEPQKAGNYWKRYEFPSKLLRVGKNEFRLTGDGKLWIARADEGLSESDRKQDSAKQAPGGGMIREELGPQNTIRGEYYVRLYLEGCFRNGELRTDWMEIADLRGNRILPTNFPVDGYQVTLSGDWHGARPMLTAFGEWKSANGHEYTTAITSHQSLEVKTDNQSRAPQRIRLVVRFLHRQDSTTQVTPQLSGVQVTVRQRAPTVQSHQFRVVETQNPKLACRGHALEAPFLDEAQFESLTHPRLTELRERYKLEEVVKGCTTDLQRMEKLAIWSSQQWTKGHLGKIYPKWDALEILKLHEDGTPTGGFCQQYNIVFLQACQSFGMVGRCVSIGAGDHGVNIRSGHEVVEVWSNELNKWVYVDGQAAWYFVDKETRTPLNLLELRERQIAALREKPFRETEVIVLAKSPYEWKGLQEWPAFCELRMIPHTQFLDGKLPLPLNQGMRGWFWTGHRVWTDDLMPASILYDKRITNPRDWNFTVNHTQFWLTQRETEGELDVRLAHNMPSFEHYVFKIGEGEEQIEKRSNLTWRLHKGENRFQVQAVNKLGLRGPASWAKVKWE